MIPQKLLSYGEVLWDLIDGQACLGGAPFNLAAHASLCGLQSYLLTRIGEDEWGRRIQAEMNRLGVLSSYVQIDAQHPTGMVTVDLSTEGQPSYRIHKNAAWDFIDVPHQMLSALAAEHFDVICFGTLSQRELPARESLTELLQQLRGVPAFFDVNLRQDFYSPELISAGLRRAAVLKLNDHEVRIVSEMLFHRPMNEGDFTEALQQEFPIQLVLITMGEKGCMVVEGKMREICPAPKIEVVDTVGAGDAFSAAFLAEWLQGKSAVEAACAGNERGAWVASQRGAVPEGSKEIR